MKTNLFFVFVTFILSSFAHAELMPYDHAEATLNDLRFQKFVNAMTKTYDVECPLPKPGAIDAEVTQIGGGDYSSTFYKFRIPCGKDAVIGLTGIVVNVEFSPPLGSPLDMDLTATFRE